MINLQKHQSVSLKKSDGGEPTQISVGCRWGTVPARGGFLLLSTVQRRVTLNLSCVMIDKFGNVCDRVYSPHYKDAFLEKLGCQTDKRTSKDGAVRYAANDPKSGKDCGGETDNEIVTVDLGKVAPGVAQIFFFLNNCGKEDFCQIPYTGLRVYEGGRQSADNVLAQYDIASVPRFAGLTAMVLGKLYRRNGEWMFEAIGDAFYDPNLCFTIARISIDYA